MSFSIVSLLISDFDDSRHRLRASQNRTDLINLCFNNIKRLSFDCLSNALTTFTNFAMHLCTNTSTHDPYRYQNQHGMAWNGVLEDASLWLQNFRGVPDTQWLLCLCMQLIHEDIIM